MSARTFPRPFILHRAADHTGVSVPGDVAEGVVWTDGTAALRWRGPNASTVIWASMAAALSIHGHDGATRPVFADGDDGELARSAATVAELRDTARTLRATLDRVPAEHRPHCPHGNIAHHDECPFCDRDTTRRRALLADPAHELAERLDVAAQLASALCDHLPGDAWHLADAVHRLCAGEITPQQALDLTTE